MYLQSAFCWWNALLQIGEQLKEKFDSATEVEPRTSHSGSRRHLVPRSPTYKPHTDADLVYLDRSPDYCEYDSKTGSLGTHGRPCNKVKRGWFKCRPTSNGLSFANRRRKPSTDATCSAATEATRATEKGGPNGACANSTGAALSTAKRVCVKSKCTPVCDTIKPHQYQQQFQLFVLKCPAFF